MHRYQDSRSAVCVGEQTSEAELPHSIYPSGLEGPLRTSRGKNKPCNETKFNSFQGEIMLKKTTVALIALVGAGFLAKLILKNKFEN